MNFTWKRQSLKGTSFLCMLKASTKHHGQTHSIPTRLLVGKRCMTVEITYLREEDSWEHDERAASGWHPRVASNPIVGLLLHLELENQNHPVPTSLQSAREEGEANSLQRRNSRRIFNQFPPLPEACSREAHTRQVSENMSLPTSWARNQLDVS